MDQSGSAAGGKERQPPRPGADHEFPIWLMRTAADRLRRAGAKLLMGPQYGRLSQFSHDMWTCSRSSVDIAQALQLCLKPHSKSRLGERWASAPAKVRSGATLTESLQNGADLLPAFYLPVIEAGELSGRVDDAFDFLHKHCKLLAGPAQAIRNVWLFPLCIMIGGSVIKFGLTLAMGSFTDAFGLLFTEIFSWAQLAIIVAVIALTPLRLLFDQARLALPWIGELEREIAVYRFFRVMSLVYGVSAGRVESMIRTASKTVTNQAAQNDLLKAATAIENGATISESFHAVTLLTPDEKGYIDVGELSGTLEQCFDEIANQNESKMMTKLAILQPLLTRIVMAVVTFSIITTLIGILLR